MFSNRSGFPPLELEIVSDAAELHKLTPEWWALWRSNPTATPFQSAAWLIPWWTAFAPGRLLVLAVRRGCQLVGLAPFYVAQDRRARPLGVSASDYFDVLIDPACFEPVADVLQRALLGTITDSPAEWEMPGVPPGAQALIFASAGRIAPTEVCPVLEIAPGTTDLSAILPEKKSKSLGRARRRASRIGSVEIRPAASTELASGLMALVKLHGMRWRERGGGVLKGDRVQRFHAMAIQELDQAGMLDLLLCKIETEIAGVYYGMRDQSRAYAYLLGFDPARAFMSPGALLIGYAIERAARNGAREFHFLRGNEAYKYAWGAADRISSRIIISREIAT